MKRILIPGAVAGSLLARGAAEAATATTNMTVQMTVAASCTVSATTLDFGTQTLVNIGANIDATSTLTVTCSTGAPYNIAMNAGANDGGTGITARKMLIGGGGTETLNYQIYRDAGRTNVWGFTTGGGTPDVVTGTGNGAGQSVTVYGRVPAGQNGVKIGTYTDTITVTVNY
jgi:spore coat protein U-like protein